MPQQGCRKPIEYRITESGCWECTSHYVCTSTGYPEIRALGKLYNVHRYVFEQEYGPVPPKFCVLHRCDNRLCINPEHLFLGTRDDNMQDMIEKGRDYHPTGALTGRAKLTESQVATIKQKGIYTERVAKKYGVAKCTLYAIKRGWSWPDVQV